MPTKPVPHPRGCHAAVISDEQGLLLVDMPAAHALGHSSEATR